MPFLHIANTFFEWELVQKRDVPLEDAFHQHEVFLQLQFLPFLYGNKEDGVAVTKPPSEEFFKNLKSFGITPPRLHLLSEKSFAYDAISSWGASQSIQRWAKEKGLLYEMPPWEVVKEVNSKEYSFKNSPKLSHATLLKNQEETTSWLSSFSGEKILKTSFGVSGRGHLFLDDASSKDPKKYLPFLQREWKENRAVIAEPYVKRALDFSTQWKISKEQKISYLGATVCENDPKGRYRSNRVGNDEKIFGKFHHHLLEHKAIALPILSQIAALGYFGNVGIDAMLYYSLVDPEIICLHPIVEINARKTMGYAALEMAKRHFPDEIVSLHYVSKNESGLLPVSLLRANGSEVIFSKQLILGSAAL